MIQEEQAKQEPQTPTSILTKTLKESRVDEKFQMALGEHKDAFIASIIDVYNGDTALQSCDKNAVITEALKAAVLKLPINKALGFSYIVVYNNSRKDANGLWVKVPTPTFVMGYKGYLQLAMRTGAYECINTDVVHEGELVSHDLLSGEIVLDAKAKKSDKVVGYFAYYRLLNGMRKVFYMSVEDMAAYAKRYSPSVKRDTTVEDLIRKAQDTSAPSGKAVGWEGNFTDMALKTCIRRLLSKYGYLSVEMQNAVEFDMEAKPQNIVVEPNAAASKPKITSFEDASFTDVTNGEVKPAETAEGANNEPDF